MRHDKISEPKKILPKKVEKKMRDLDLYEAIPNHDKASMTIDEKAKQVNKLSVKHQRFLSLYLENGNAKKSYKMVYPNANDTTATTNGYRILKKHRWILEAILHKSGITPHNLATKLSKLVNNKDPRVRLSAIRLGFDQLEKSIDDDVTDDGKGSTVVIVKDSEAGSFAIGVKNK